LELAVIEPQLYAVRSIYAISMVARPKAKRPYSEVIEAAIAAALSPSDSEFVGKVSDEYRTRPHEY